MPYRTRARETETSVPSNDGLEGEIGSVWSGNTGALPLLEESEEVGNGELAAPLGLAYEDDADELQLELGALCFLLGIGTAEVNIMQRDTKVEE